MFNTAEIVAFFRNYLKYIQKRFIWILLLGLIGLAIGFFYAYKSKPYYKANLSFLINDGKGVSGNPLSALAGQFGLQVNSPNLSEDRIIYLFSTKRILGNALLRKRKLNSNGQTIGDAMLDFYQLRPTLKQEDLSLGEFKQFDFSSMENLPPIQNFAMGQLLLHIQLTNKLVIEPVKRKAYSLYGNQSNGIISITFECKDEVLAQEFVNALYEELVEFYSQSILKNLKYNYEILNARADSVKTLLTKTERESAIESDNAFKVFKFEGRVNELRKRKEIELLNAIFVEVVKNREMAKYTMEQERPLFQVIDMPNFPLEKIYKSKVKFSLLGFFGFVFVFSMFVTGFYLFGLRKRPTS